MKPFYRNLCLTVMAAVAAFSVYGAASTWMGNSRHFPAQTHAWLHQALNVNAEQDKMLTVIEQKFAEQRKALEARIRGANSDLANAILEDRRYSERVRQAVDNIHKIQGELQQATLQHLFEMQEALTPEQANKLNTLAADALFSNP